MQNPDKYYLPYGRQKITQKDIDAVNSVLSSNYLTQGPLVPQFERKVSKLLNVDFSLAVANATSALHLACVSLGLTEGDILWTSPNTFVASANCGRYCGAEIDFVDININTGLMDINELKNKLVKAKLINKLPKILIPVHFAGTSCDMESIYNLSKEYGFSIIEDASHALGGFYKNNPVGNCKYSDCAVFSFHPVKIITTAEGGMLCTNNKKIADLVMKLRSHGITKDKELFENEYYGEWSYEQQSLGFNYRMNELEAALGISQIDRLNSIVKERNRQLELYKKELSDMPLKILEIPNDVISAVHLCVILLKDFSVLEHKEIFSNLRKKGIGVQLHYWPVHLNPYYRKLGFEENDFKNAEIYSTKAISLPLFPGLKDLDILNVVKILKSIISEYKKN
ncbi:MAG: UDP-4-amino-4,6-dideoxy-N-acetyl-beta-L-altrosamine transaminase [Prochlorococcus sp. SP3034]|nr:UDP-4-amino-4,6-dideoxy-N-acetyl-beta-L-altrosamine transaminase [Prochlorococcus sp. SP3034]|tara:strand:+ start:16340 stop:17530 length:1191 start_codon:yes stop_codon:yes gene_type:complete